MLLPRPERTPPQWLTEWTYAHRGLHREGVAENSLHAARLAIEAGLAIECDIQRSRDNHPMVFHDWELNRLTGAVGAVSCLTRGELQRLEYRQGGEAPASLDQLLDLVAGRVPVLIEIKSRRGYDVGLSCQIAAETLRRYRGNHAVMSFDPRAARWFRRNSPATPVGLVMREDEHGYTQRAWQRALALWIAQPDFLAYHIEALPNPMVARLRRRGLAILTWTVNSPALRERAGKFADAMIAEGEGIA